MRGCGYGWNGSGHGGRECVGVVGMGVGRDGGEVEGGHSGRVWGGRGYLWVYMGLRQRALPFRRPFFIPLQVFVQLVRTCQGRLCPVQFVLHISTGKLCTPGWSYMTRVGQNRMDAPYRV